MKIKNLIFLLLTIACIQVCLGQGASEKPMKDVKGFTSKFEASVKILTSIKSDFTQEKHLSFMDDSITSKGIFRYKKENKVRLEYTSPFKYLMVLSNGKIYIKEGNKTSKYDTKSNKIFKQVNDMMINTMNGNVLNSKDYIIKYLENDNDYILELIPQDKSVTELISKLKVYIDKKKMHVSKVRIVEKSGDYTLMTFLNIQQNAVIKDEEFVVK